MSRERRRQRGAAVAAAVLAFTATLVGCDSSDDPDEPADQQSGAEAWATEVCSTTATWRTAMDDAQATLADTDNLSSATVRETLDDIATATVTLVTDLDGLGAPDTEAGDEAQAQLSSLSDQLHEQADIVTTAADQPAGGLQELLGQVSTVTGAVATMLADVGTAVDALRQLDGADELEDAFRSSPSCQELLGTESPTG